MKISWLTSVTSPFMTKTPILVMDGFVIKKNLIKFNSIHSLVLSQYSPALLMCIFLLLEVLEHQYAATLVC